VIVLQVSWSLFNSGRDPTRERWNKSRSRVKTRLHLVRCDRVIRRGGRCCYGRGDGNMTGYNSVSNVSVRHASWADRNGVNICNVVVMYSG
jgi:hypothetical protein